MNTERTTCGEVREKLPLYVGGDLDGEVLEAVRSHLERCAECARRTADAVRARRELVAAFRAREADAARPELWAGLRAVLRAEGLIHEPGERLPATPARAGARRWTLLVAPAAAAALLLAVLQLSGVFGGVHVQPEPGTRGVGPGIAEVEAVPVSTGGLQRIPPDQVRPRVRLPASDRGQAETDPGSGVSLTGLPPGVK